MAQKRTRKQKEPRPECTASSEIRKQGEPRAVETDCPLASAHPSKVVKWIVGMLAEGWRLAV